MEKLLNNKWTWITLISLVVIASVVFGIYTWGKKAGTDATAPVIPGEVKPDGTVVNNALTTEERSKINDLAKRLQDDIEDYTPNWRDNDAYSELSRTSDRIFVGVANQYKSLTKENLFSSIQDETYLNFETRVLIENIVNRARALNLL
jgi:hypothetical protein